ncbi:hypothetical protein MAXJ12_22997 [Mesorhizobium alhagi CCNWXJ12-2]|uniref:Transposase n=1 Tax=Mesorhizobium alhagi CCNWXJ12-2 TaxID=1107882 RepID=H0HWN4_9HYPH|nr:hypothetical protein MAXJ12_22997 [Mesorhizobium alhagi CCNWXJ12-2]
MAAQGDPLRRPRGIEISRNSMANWMGHVGFHLTPLADRILALIMRGTIEPLADRRRPWWPIGSRTAAAARASSAISPATLDCSRSMDGVPIIVSPMPGAPAVR